MSCEISGALPLDAARTRLLAQLDTVVGTEWRDLAAAAGCILATDVVARMASPAFDNSAMDGYALQAGDLAATGALPVCGRALAGHPFQGDWPAGSVVRIMTGAPVPAGTAAVVMQEQTLSVANGPQIRLLKPVTAGANIRLQGEDITAGSTVLAAGSRLNARNLPLLAAVGISQVCVYRPLRVAYFSSGDELCSPQGWADQPAYAGMIVDTNRLALQTMLVRLGCTAIDLGIIPDDPAALRAAFLHADAVADVLITSGGVSVGDADYTKTVLNALGEVAFWKVAIKPGKPFACGRLVKADNQRWFFGLPGNPVSAQVTFLLLVRPALERMMGLIAPAPLAYRARLARDLKLTSGRIDFQRGVLGVNTDGELLVDTAGAQGSGMFMAMARANCLIQLDEADFPDQRLAPAGSRVPVWLFDEVMA